jgi:hypothetical protein
MDISIQARDSPKSGARQSLLFLIWMTAIFIVTSFLPIECQLKVPTSRRFVVLDDGDFVNP